MKRIYVWFICGGLISLFLIFAFPWPALSTHYGTIYVPLVRSSSANGVETYIKLQSSETTAGTNGIRVDILADDGTFVSADMGTIVAGTPFTISGADLIAKVAEASKTVDGNAGFAVKIYVDSAHEFIYGYANIVDAAGTKRIPLSTVDGIGGYSKK